MTRALYVGQSHKLRARLVKHPMWTRIARAQENGFNTNAQCWVCVWICGRDVLSRAEFTLKARFHPWRDGEPDSVIGYRGEADWPIPAVPSHTLSLVDARSGDWISPGEYECGVYAWMADTAQDFIQAHNGVAQPPTNPLGSSSNLERREGAETP